MPPKQSATQRRVSNPPSKVSTAPPADKTPKSSKPSRVLRFNLPKSRLSLFPHEQATPKSVPKKKSPLSTSTLATPADPPQQELKSEPNETPAPIVPKIEPPTTENTMKKESSSPKTGSKRELGAGVEEPVKVKARPGPKKKPRL